MRQEHGAAEPTGSCTRVAGVQAIGTKLSEEAGAFETPWHRVRSRERPCPIHSCWPRAKTAGLRQVA